MAETELDILLSSAIPANLVGDVRAKLFYLHESVSEVYIAGPGDSVRLKLKPGARVEHESLSNRVHQIVTRMCAGSDVRAHRIYADHLNRPVPFSQDPLPLLQQAGQVWEENRGSYVLGPLLCQLVSFFDAQVLAMARRFGAVPYQFPALLNVDILERVRYLRSFPHALSLVFHLREDLDLIEAFSKQTACRDSRLDINPSHVTGVENALSPSVCFHFYGMLKDRILENHPCIATALGRCFRYEAGNFRGLERLWEFSMREIVFVGSREFVLNARAKCLEETVSLLDSLKLAYSIESATDPFFVSEFASQAMFQSAFDLKQEIRLKLPFQGGTIAGGSINYHLDFFTNGLNIRDAAGHHLQTACIGLGFERCAYALLAQHGVDPLGWPEPLRNWLTECPQ